MYEGLDGNQFDLAMAFQNPAFSGVTNPYGGFQFPMGIEANPYNVGTQDLMNQQAAARSGDPAAKKKPIILEQTNNRFLGRLKFFDEAKGYGFIIMDDDNSDIFCHFDDFFKAGIDLNMLKSAKMGHIIRLSFQCLSYIGRHNRSRKAVDLQLLEG